MLPTFLIIGAARCATSWIAKNLMEHPEIYLHPKKELHFFDRHYNKGIKFYESYFIGRDEKAIGEATPAYLFFPHIPKLIRQHMPEVKLIVSLRNPIDRAYSHYWNLISKEKKSVRKRAESFEIEIRKNDRLIKEGFYYDMLSRYYQIFPKENILVKIYEDIIDDSAGFIKSIFSFLNVDTEYIPNLLDYRLNASSTKLWECKLLYYFYLTLMKKIRLYKVASFLEKNNSKVIPPIQKDTKDELLQIFNVQIDQLEQFIERDLDIWRIKK